MKISTILDNIDLGSIALPEFQRGYVWNRNQVRKFMQSLYRRYPVGSLLVWLTPADTAAYRGSDGLSPGIVKLLLDGQQRVTTLYGIIRGKPPAFFEGNAQVFLDLYFNLEEEIFEFYMPIKMQGNPLWVNVTEIMQKGIISFLERISGASDLLDDKMKTYIGRLNAVENIKEIDLHVEEVTGEDKTIEIVVDIFNMVNSGGTKLSKGDLALAKICTLWPEARKTMRDYLAQWNKAGFNFSLEWLLRNANAILTGEAFFDALENVSAADFQKGLAEARNNSNYLLNMISGRLGLDHDRVLGGRYAFPVMARYLSLHGGKISDARERDRLLYWYVHSFLWGRFAGATESTLSKDLKVLEPIDGALDRLIEQLRLSRGDLTVRPENFAGWSLGARFYPMVYLLTRVYNALDWGSGVPLSANLLGKLNALQIHHIFPKSLLYDYGYSKAEVNAIANYCFLTQDTNLKISNTKPEIYLPEVEKRFPGALASQWVPADPKLWKMENYTAFLAERRKLLAEAANRFLDELLTGSAAIPAMIDYSQALAVSERTQLISGDTQELIDWIKENHLPDPEIYYEIADAHGEVLTIADLAWPDGVQKGYSEPVALLLEEDKKQADILSQAGYHVYLSIESLKKYLNQIIGT